MTQVPSKAIAFEATASAQASDVTWERLEDQIGWYDRKSRESQRWFKRIKVVELIIAAALPTLAALGASAAVVSIPGSLIVVFEGLLHLFQYQEHWITYRSTCEALKHERYLYLATAGPYAAAPSPTALLAERIEGLVSQEHAKWASTQQQTIRSKNGQGT